MRIRSGYVSNSSSSSFIVVIKDNFGKESGITMEQEEILRSFGFKYVKEYWKSALKYGAELFNGKESFSDKDGIAMYYYVSCNEDEVMDFLIENKIPFVESEHYGMRLVHYDGVHDYYDTFYNEGERILTYCFDGDENLDDMMKMKCLKQKPFVRTRISDGCEIEME